MKLFQRIAIVSTLHFITVTAEAQPATSFSFRVSPEHPKWVAPANYGKVVADFDVVVPASSLVVEAVVTVEMEHCSGLDMGKVLAFLREGDRSDARPLDETFHTGLTSRENEISVKYGKESGLFQTGMSLLYVVVGSVPPPSTEQAGSLITTRVVLKIVDMESGKQSWSVCVASVRVRGRHPVIRIDPKPTLFADFTLFVEGGLPEMNYNIFSSTNLIEWRKIGSFRNFAGDSSTGGRVKTLEFF